MRRRDRPAIDPWEPLPPAELLATVALAPAPDIPLAAIRELLSPRHDAHGRVIDWLLTASGFEHRHAVAAYTTWRRTWRRQWPIGPATNLGSLLDEVGEIDHDLTRHLEHLLAPLVDDPSEPVVVSAALATAIVAELDTVRLALSVDERTGTGLVDDMPERSRGAGLARSWAPPHHDVVLAATSSTAVVLRPDRGVVLLHDGPRFTAFEDVTGVDLRAETAIVMNARGASLRLTPDQARPLGWLVPRSLRWHLRSIPLVAVWAPAFDGLRSALLAAADTGDDLVLSGETTVR